MSPRCDVCVPEAPVPELLGGSANREDQEAQTSHLVTVVLVFLVASLPAGQHFLALPRARELRRCRGHTLTVGTRSTHRTVHTHMHSVFRSSSLTFL